jgi:hypothetical protein
MLVILELCIRAWIFLLLLQKLSLKLLISQFLSQELFFQRIYFSSEAFDLKFDIFGFVIYKMGYFIGQIIYILYIFSYFSPIVRPVVFLRWLKDIWNIQIHIDLLFFNHFLLPLGNRKVRLLWFLCLLLWFLLWKFTLSWCKLWYIDTSRWWIHRVCCRNTTKLQLIYLIESYPCSLLYS